VPLFDEQGQRIRGKESKEAAELTLAREKLSWETEVTVTPGSGEWLVLHPTNEFGVFLWRNAILLLQPRLKVVFLSRRNTVSFEIDSTTSNSTNLSAKSRI